jgi:hypothetical protein
MASSAKRNIKILDRLDRRFPDEETPGAQLTEFAPRIITARSGARQLLAKTKEVATAGRYELFKTSSHFDSTAKHPDWLGGDTPGVQKLAPPGA